MRLIKRDTLLASKINRDGGIEKIIDQETEMRLDTLHQAAFGVKGFEIFVCSFCAHKAKHYAAQHGLLSQWRGYGADGGVAIVLNTRKIERMMGEEQSIFAHRINHIGEVVYDDNNKKIKRDFCDVFKYYPEILKRLYSNERPSHEKIYKHFIYGSTLVKHHAFNDENEIRIVVSSRPTKDSIFYISEHDMKPSKIVCYTQKGDREARYIELFGHNPLPIERVIVGPSHIQNFNYQTISDLVKNSDIEVVKSETPLLA